VPIERMRAWETALIRYVETSHPEVGRDITEKKRITEDNEKKLRAALDTFKSTWQ
jgi:F-type H+-transporting ATPase subunit alpha